MIIGRSTLDCIVLGFGGVGSPALYFAAKKSWKVLGIDRFGPAHSFGSSHGQSRIIRTAYFEHPDYVPLAQRSFQLWGDLQALNGKVIPKRRLLQKTGLLQIGSPDGIVIRGLKRSIHDHDLNCEFYSPDEMRNRFPILKIPDGSVGIFEPDAGLLRVEWCVANWLKRAREAGAILRGNTIATGWDVEDNGDVVVHLLDSNGDHQSVRTRRLIVSAGAWAGGLIPELAGKLQVVRMQQQWFQMDTVATKIENGFPCFLVETGDRCFYGFPELDYLGVKVAEHSGGQPVDDPTTVDRSLDRAALNRVEEFIDQHFHHGKRRLVHNSHCLYTMSPDEHFIIDAVKDAPQIVYAAGLSGHGFKFTPAIGQRLVGMLEGEPDPLFDFLRQREFS